MIDTDKHTLVINGQRHPALFFKGVGRQVLENCPAYGGSSCGGWHAGNSVTQWVAPHACNWVPPKTPLPLSAAHRAESGAAALHRPYAGLAGADAAPNFATHRAPMPHPRQMHQARQQGAGGPCLLTVPPKLLHTKLRPSPWKQQAKKKIFAQTTRSVTIPRHQQYAYASSTITHKYVLLSRYSQRD
jgi:hypothetical protein